MNQDNNLFSDGVSIAICVLAAVIGPYILINAKFSFGFLYGGLVYSVLCLGIYYLVEMIDNSLFRHISNDSLRLRFGILLGYLPFVFLILYLYGNNYSAFFKITAIQSLFNLPVLFLFLVILLAYLKYTGSPIKWAIRKIGMYYFFPLFIVLLLIPLIPNSEGKVVLVNLAVIFFFAKLILLNLPRKALS